MKLYQDYKKQYRKFLILFLGFLIIFPFVFSYAQTVNELNDKINQKNTDISLLEEEIKKYQIELNDLSKQKNSLNVSIKQLDITKKKLNADISVTQNKIDKTNLKIQELSLNINNKQNIIYNNIDVISSDIRIINQFEQNDAILLMLSENNFTNVWNDIDNIVAVNDAIIKSTTELKQVKIVLEDTREETTKAKNELLSLKSKLSDQKKIVDENTREKNKLLIQTKNNENNYQKLLKDGLAKKDAFEKELRDYESQLKYILDPSKLPDRGVLSWPLDYVLITQSFGKTKDDPAGHGGVDFRASVGTSVKAMADGVIKGVGDTDTTCSGTSFGKWVFIEYNNGLSSAFGHMSLIKGRTGDKVSRGQVVGYSGNTGYSKGPHLHVTIYAPNAAKVQTIQSANKYCLGKTLTQPMAASNAYLNPLYYLPKTTAAMFK